MTRPPKLPSKKSRAGQNPTALNSSQIAREEKGLLRSARSVEISKQLLGIHRDSYIPSLSRRTAVKYTGEETYKPVVINIANIGQLAPNSKQAKSRYELLEEFAKRHAGEGVAEFARSLFPDIGLQDNVAAGVSQGSTTELPSVAPTLWSDDKQKGETPPAFIKRVYGEWLGHGLTRAHFRQLDPDLWQSLTVWLRLNHMPADIDLPTRAEQNTRWIARVEKEGFAALGEGQSADFIVREAARLAAAKHRRSQIAAEPDENAARIAVSLPSVAPETYTGLRSPETPPAFVQRVYGPWLGQGLDRAHIRHLDPKLSTAINNWLSRPGNEWPPEVDLPTRKEQNDRAIERLDREGISSVVPHGAPSTVIREAQRLLSAKARRIRE